MQVGMIGLGRMGANMVRRWLRGRHECVVHDVSRDAVRALAGDGAVGCASLGELVDRLTKPRVVWLMVPAAAVDATLEELVPRLTAGDVVVDGGNSYYRDDVDRAKRFYQGLGWRLDTDFASGEDFRVVQLTPPGSPCSITFGTGITSAKPGSAAGKFDPSRAPP